MFELKENPVSEVDRQTFECLLEPGGLPKYVLGRNKYAASVAAVVDIEAFVDDYTDQEYYLGRPIIRMASLPADSLVVSCVVDGRPVTAMDRLRSAKVMATIDYFTLLRLGPELFKPMAYCEDNRKDILENMAEYQWVHEKLADNESRESFRKVVHFRYTFDLDFMRGFSLRIQEQYFEEFLVFGPNEVFVDGGGFDGGTSLEFAARAPDYRSIYYFEPTPDMMAISKERLGNVPKIHYIEKGLSNEKATLRFDTSSGSANRISETGQEEIQVTTLDSEVNEPISFIKIDIEGAEFDAISGAANHIREHAPKMAICVYHNQADFWRIPRRILELNSNYEIYLRHYSEGILETVMFFIPRSNNSRR